METWCSNKQVTKTLNLHDSFTDVSGTQLMQQDAQIQHIPRDIVCEDRDTIQ
jgi:hypothetical protein